MVATGTLLEALRIQTLTFNAAGRTDGRTYINHHYIAKNAILNFEYGIIFKFRYLHSCNEYITGYLPYT